MFQTAAEYGNALHVWSKAKMSKIVHFCFVTGREKGRNLDYVIVITEKLTM